MRSLTDPPADLIHRIFDFHTLDTRSRGCPMSRQCELSGVKPMVGNNVSHSQRKTKRRFEPNLVQVSLMSEGLQRTIRLRIAARTLRTIDKLGGLDAYLAQAKPDQLSERVLKIKRELEKKAAEAA